jgi:hypothetical protein
MNVEATVTIAFAAVVAETYSQDVGMVGTSLNHSS